MENRVFSIKTATREEFDIAIKWAAKEGWNPGKHDGDCYYNVDTEGFFIGYLDDEPIATISAVKYGSSFGFIGFYIVKPEYRDKGYGIQIWNRAIEYLKGRNIGLDGVVEQQENYKKSGFKLAHNNIRYEENGGGDFPEGKNIVEISKVPFETISTFTEPFFPENRDEFIKCWIDQPESRTFGYLEDGKLKGFGMIRTCHEGYKIAPLFADDKCIARLLFQALKSTVKKSEKIFLDVPDINQEAKKLAEENDMKISFETARMYTGETPNISMGRTFGITSFEIG